ncbi:protein of unknown function DUF814 [Pyrolobus fumarii 1A]|uniref:NFACT RNA-binding domain-containing protein n=1 Tax=Pyrolobus fumarii (strain DSM 11204 / 1A) TaxID=694429 RepID=G0ECK1_PYRF1|nr:ribosome rescue protein RqcH [Pyrolobus fumarii]AEM39571.1 protein of unknown function DUF814 [Pyrolobus fumarii 1A]
MAKRKTSMTAFDVASVVRELEELKGARLVNIYEVFENVYLLRLRGTRDARVIAEPGRRVHETSYDVTGKEQPPPLIMALRKHIRGERLSTVKQLGFDRIILFEFANGYKLVVELLPRGVLALLDEKGSILHASEWREMRDRVIKRGVEYKQPPPAAVHPENLTEDVVRERLAGASGEVVRVLVRKLGYPGEVVEEALFRAGIEKTTPVEKLGASDIGAIVEAIRGIYRESLEARGYIVYDEKGLVLTVVPFKPSMYEGRYRAVESISKALDEYFVELEKARAVEEAVEKLEEEKGKLRAAISKTEELIREYEEKKVKLEKLALLVAENAALVDQALECARRMREGSGWDYIPGNCPGVVDVEPSRGVVKLNIGGSIVEVDIRSDSARLINELYRKIGELEKKRSRALRTLEELKKKLESLELEIREEARRARARIRRKEWYEKYHWMFTSHWLLVIGGRDASQNESVVKRYLGENNIFMHADIRGAPAVVVFAGGKEPPEEDIREAAVIAACYSRAWKEGLGAIDVYWVWGRQVSKAAPPGEYLTKGAFMVYGERNYIRGVELKLAIGLAEENDAPVVIVGPRELVRRRSLVYALLAPGDEEPSKLAKRLVRLFSSKLGDKAYLAKSLDVNELLRRIPGPSRVLEIARGEAREPPRPRAREAEAEEES